MKYDIYHSLNLKIKTPLLAQTIIIKDEQINKILEKYYGNTEFIISNESKFFDEIIWETSKEKLYEYFNVGRDVYDLLLEPLQKFLEDMSLSLSLYETTQIFTSKIPTQDLMNRKPIDNIPLYQFQKLPFIYSHSFLDAIVKIANTIFIMTKENKTPFISESVREKIILIKNEFDSEFVHVRDIRHSWQHIEDRVRAKGQNEKDIIGNLLVLSSLINDNLHYTIADGTTQYLSITEKTFRRAEYYVQKTFDSFEWVQGKKI